MISKNMEMKNKWKRIDPPMENKKGQPGAAAANKTDADIQGLMGEKQANLTGIRSLGTDGFFCSALCRSDALLLLCSSARLVN